MDLFPLWHVRGMPFEKKYVSKGFFVMNNISLFKYIAKLEIIIL